MKNETKEQALLRVKNANKIDYLNIYAFALVWLGTRFKSFSADDLKDAYFECGGLPPNQPSVIGSVFMALSKDNLIFHHGYTVSKNPVAHGRMLRTWISRNYKEKQQSNASNKSNLKLEL